MPLLIIIAVVVGIQYTGNKLKVCSECFTSCLAFCFICIDRNRMQWRFREAHHCCDHLGTLYYLRRNTTHSTQHFFVLLFCWSVTCHSVKSWCVHWRILRWMKTIRKMFSSSLLSQPWTVRWRPLFYGQYYQCKSGGSEEGENELCKGSGHG